MKIILALSALALFAAPTVFAAEFTCKVKDSRFYSGQYTVKVTENGMSIHKRDELIASGPAAEGKADYELKKNNEVVEEGAEVYLSKNWSAKNGGEFTIVDRSRDLGNEKSVFSCEPK
jgi:hypothetical protein